MTEQALKFRVVFYDAKMSRKGKGMRQATFTERDKAEEFAKGKVAYGRPAKVDEYREVVA